MDSSPQRDPVENLSFESLRSNLEEEVKAAKKRGPGSFKVFKRRAAQCLAEDFLEEGRKLKNAKISNTGTDVIT